MNRLSRMDRLVPSFFASGSDRFTCSGSVIDGRGIFTAATISRVTLAGATTAGVRIVQGTSPDLVQMLQVDTHHPRRQARFQQFIEQYQQRWEYPFRCIMQISRNVPSVVLK